MFTAAIGSVPCSASTRSRARIWSLTKLSAQGALPVPQSSSEENRENTCIATRSAPRATPKFGPVQSLPATEPATCVPWSQPVTVVGQFVPEPGPVIAGTPPGQSEVEAVVVDE